MLSWVGHQSRFAGTRFPPENGHFEVSSMNTSSGGVELAPLTRWKHSKLHVRSGEVDFNDRSDKIF
jgi:hypothetical protein